MSGDYETEAEARAVNAEPWEPPPGMLKARCAACSYWFAAPDARVERCPDCRLNPRRKGEISRGHSS
jgi:hypothetical protein